MDIQAGKISRYPTLPATAKRKEAKLSSHWAYELKLTTISVGPIKSTETRKG